MSLYERQKRYFEKAYETGEHGWPVTGPDSFVLKSVRRIFGKRPPQDGRVLDLGCGEGRHTFACAGMGLQTVGLDYQPSAITRALSMPEAKRTPRRYHFLSGDAFRLPFRPASVDVVIDYGCFHHVRKSDTRKYLDSLTAVLAPGGHFILSCFSWRFRHHPGERRKRDWIVHQGHYDRFFRKSDFSRIFGGRFDVLKIEEKRDGHWAFFHVLMRRKAKGRS
jgi:SAM-dependent methyltransferase